ncbi:MAG: ATP-binding protein [Bacteroidales bacterium]|nr:ATP-binding protein [Bacteroidales bacterium]
MYFTEFFDREKVTERLKKALRREDEQFIVIYGRRRIGKSQLIKRVLDFDRGDVYFLSDQTNETNQRALLAVSMAQTIPGFDQVTYPSWESIFQAFNRQIDRRVTLCLDEFPYMVKSFPALTSIIQKLLNGKDLKFDLIICGSSQQLMQGYVLDRTEPLYGLSNEIIRLAPLPASYILDALQCEARQGVEEFAIWGGVPRYWELRMDYDSLDEAIDNLILDPNGILAEEPQRLLYEDMRQIVQAATLLSIIGNGVNRLSEIASRAGKAATAITEPLSRLIELDLVRRDLPFGELEKNSKKGLYKIKDPLTHFYFRFVAPYRSLLQMGHSQGVKQIIASKRNEYVAECWELLCQEYVSGKMINGIAYGKASNWRGRDLKGLPVELDVVAQSLDHKRILIGECKWTKAQNADFLKRDLLERTRHLPFVKDNTTIEYVLFLKEPPTESTDIPIYLPQDILSHR